MDIRALLFDVNGTLIDIETDVQKQVARLIKRPRSLQAALAEYVLFQFKLKEPHHDFVRVLLTQMFSRATAESPCDC